MIKLRCVIMRGGTSKAVFFHENELPSDPKLRDKVVLDVFGSPDIRQIDGLGGADGSTSKLSIISRHNGTPYFLAVSLCNCIKPMQLPRPDLALGSYLDSMAHTAWMK
jgi:hypothetical protein